MQIGALSTVEAKKRFDFLEAFSGTVEAHLRYFKQVKALTYKQVFWRCMLSAIKTVCSMQGYELLHEMEPFMKQVFFPPNKL